MSRSSVTSATAKAPASWPSISDRKRAAIVGSTLVRSAAVPFARTVVRSASSPSGEKKTISATSARKASSASTNSPSSAGPISDERDSARAAW